MAATRRTATATPAPIPAFAPVASPLECSAVWVAPDVLVLLCELEVPLVEAEEELVVEAAKLYP